MPVTIHPTGSMSITGKSIEMYRLLALKGALKIFIKTGMKMSRGPSALSICKREFGFKGNSEKVLAQLEEKIKTMQRIKVMTGIMDSQFAGECGDEQRVYELEEWEALLKEAQTQAEQVENGVLPPMAGLCVGVNEDNSDGSIIVVLIVDTAPAEPYSQYGNGRYVTEVGPSGTNVLVVNRYFTPVEPDEE